MLPRIVGGDPRHRGGTSSQPRDRAHGGPTSPAGRSKPRSPRSAIFPRPTGRRSAPSGSSSAPAPTRSISSRARSGRSWKPTCPSSSGGPRTPGQPRNFSATWPRECSRLILDLPDPATEPEAIRIGLDPSLNPFARDTAWFGITRWRELVAQFFDGPDPLSILSKLASVEISALVPDEPKIPRVAAWLASWLAGQLGWTPVEPSRNRARPPGRDLPFLDRRGQSDDPRQGIEPLCGDPDPGRQPDDPR